MSTSTISLLLLDLVTSRSSRVDRLMYGCKRGRLACSLVPRPHLRGGSGNETSNHVEIQRLGMGVVDVGFFFFYPARMRKGVTQILQLIGLSASTKSPVLKI